MKEIRFVDVGEGITEGHVRKWLVTDGAVVKEDQSVVQVETDKAVVSVPSPITGTLKQAVPENTTVHVGDAIAFIGEPSELQSIPATATKPQFTPAKTATQIQEAVSKAREMLATPAVRKLSHDLGVDLNQVIGTGPGGRILESDVRSAGHTAATQTKAIPKFSESMEEAHKGEIERTPMSQTRKAIAKNMEASWTIPRAVHMDLLNANSLFGVVAKEKPNLQKMDVHLTFLPFIIKAVVEALKENPRFNSSYDHETQEILIKKYYNIGLAAEAEDGLKVVVIKNADKKSIMEIAKEIQELHKKIQDQTITLDEMHDSTFTITNVGSLGGGFLSVPMINYPEVAILGVHMLKDMPVVENGQVKVGKVLPISLSFDHRVVDGADAVKFGNAIIQYLEDPDFLEMLG